MSTETLETTQAAPQPKPEAAYVLLDVKRSYELDGVAVEALRGVDLQIDNGEYVVIEGPSGSGKSTLLQLMGLLDTPTNGKITCGGESVASLDEDELAALRLERIGFIFQQFNLIPTLTARQNIEIAMFPSDRSTTEARDRARDLLAQVGLSERADHFPSQLSGGEQQRVAIARALSNEPQILLADEPTGNLDTETGREILDVIKALWNDGLTVVLITHDRTIADHSTRTLLLRDGAIVSGEH
ncbi:MAG: ABC transporter ATP-binding protein [Solirubrobacterales bacterium]